MIHLLKGCIGAGILAMPDAMRRLGIIFGVIAIALIGIFATYCLQVLIYSMYEVAKRQRTAYVPYGTSMRLAILEGPGKLHFSAGFFYHLVEIMMIIWQLGVCAIYFVFCSVNVKEILHIHGIDVPVRVLICCCLPGQILMNLVRDLKYMTPFSTIANCVTVLGLLLVSYYIVEDDVEIDDEKLRLKGLIEIPFFIATTLFAMEAVGVVLSLEYTMERPQRFVGVFGVLSIGFFLVCLMFVLLAVPGYLKYGNATKSSITLNLPSHEKKAQAAQIAFTIAVYLSFPLQNYVAYEVMWQKIQNRFPKAGKLEDYTLRVVCVLLPFAASVIQPNLGALISLMGALCLSLLGIILPGIMDACLWYPVTYGAFKYKLLRDIGIIMVGFFCLIAGVYSSILEFL